MINKGLASIRRLLYSLASNEGLFVFAAFLSAGVLGMDPMGWYREQTNAFQNYIVVPWGMALCLLRLYKRTQSEEKERFDIAVLFVLLAWIVVPFAIRFGMTFNNTTSWHGYAVVYFGVYALTSEETAKRREQLFDTACMIFGLFSLVFGGVLLYTAWMVQAFGEGIGGYAFGICDGMFLCSGVHYNTTGMLAVCCTMLCLAGLDRSKNVVIRALYALAAGMMMAVIVLTQSRTARYSLVAALAIGAYGLIAMSKGQKRALIRHAAGLAGACVVLAASYGAATLLSNAALAHYDDVRAARSTKAPVALAEEKLTAEEATLSEPVLEEIEAAGGDAPTGAPEPEKLAVEETAAPSADALVPREPVDATLSGRTDIWKNLVRLWREEPEYLLIGNGPGRTGSRVVQGTIHEENGGVALHNTYLQYIADFGLVGFAFKVIFLLSILGPALRVFFAQREKRRGYLALCMLVAASLLTGMMESAPLGGMTPMNVALYFALALLTAKGREIGKVGKTGDDVV